MRTPRTLLALGNASAQAGGLVETPGTAAKSMGAGNAASSGLLSAMVAAEGFEGPTQPLEGARGFLRVMGDKPDFQSIVTSLGEIWEHFLTMPAIASNPHASSCKCVVARCMCATSRPHAPAWAIPRGIKASRKKVKCMPPGVARLAHYFRWGSHHGRSKQAPRQAR